MTESSKTISLTLNSLQEFLLEHEVGGIERNGHTLATCGGYWEGISVTATYDIDGDEESWRGREGGRVREGEGGKGGGREGEEEERTKRGREGGNGEGRSEREGRTERRERRSR